MGSKAERIDQNEMEEDVLKHLAELEKQEPN